MLQRQHHELTFGRLGLDGTNSRDVVGVVRQEVETERGIRPQLRRAAIRQTHDDRFRERRRRQHIHVIFGAHNPKRRAVVRSDGRRQARNIAGLHDHLARPGRDVHRAFIELRKSHFARGGLALSPEQTGHVADGLAIQGDVCLTGGLDVQHDAGAT